MPANNPRPAWAQRLIELRRARMWVVSDLARELKKLRPDLPSVKSLAHMIRSDWEAGRHRPNPRYRLLLAAVYDVAEEELFGDLRGNLGATDSEDDVERRRLMQDAAALAAGAAAAPVLTTLNSAWRASAPTLPGASVSQAMIDDWEDAAHIHNQRGRIDPPTVLLAALAADFADMAPHLARTQPDPVRRGLAHAASRHCALIAGKWVDLGNKREAHRWFVKTQALADESGDHLLASWMRCKEALYRGGDPSEDLAKVLVVAHEARRLAGDRPSAPLVAALSAEAQTLARLGHRTQAISALARAEMIFDRIPAVNDADTEWGWWRFNQALWYDKSLVYTLAGDVKRATEAQDAAGDLYPIGDISSTSIRLHRAALHARIAPDAGLEEATRIVEAIPPARRTRRLEGNTSIVLAALPDEKTRALPAARELQALSVGPALA
jgi:tetratricopeptide (TPR) repeat protein